MRTRWWGRCSPWQQCGGPARGCCQRERGSLGKPRCLRPPRGSLGNPRRRRPRGVGQRVVAGTPGGLGEVGD
jgi:hypothetical protein